MLAAVDVGTNTVRLLLGEVVAGRLAPVRYERMITRLGGGFDASKGLAPEAMERTLLALRAFSQILSEHEISHVRVVGTQALRQAANGRCFVDRVQTELGLTLEIIDGDVEARLSARGVVEGLFPKPQRFLVFDIGGGSTEFVFCQNDAISYSASYPLGVVSLAESCGSRTEMISKIAQQLDRFVGDAEGSAWSHDSRGYTLVGTAGTITTIAAIDLQMIHYDWRRINNHRIEKATISSLLSQLLPMSVTQREQWPGMEKGRGDLIIPGLLIVDSLLRRLQQNALVVSDFGLLEGILLSLADTANSN